MKQKKPMTFDTTKFVQADQGFITPPRSRILEKSLTAVKECINSSIFMASQIELVDQGLSTARPQSVRPAYFRASLSEVCRIEDIMEARGQPKFHKSVDPTLHIVKLLRNYQVHIAYIQFSSSHIRVKLSGEEMVYHSFIAENMNALELRKLNSSRPYLDEQLDQLSKLFDSEQRKLGVVQLLYHIAMHVEEHAKHSLTNQRRAIKNPQAAF